MRSRPWRAGPARSRSPRVWPPGTGSRSRSATRDPGSPKRSRPRSSNRSSRRSRSGRAPGSGFRSAMASSRITRERSGSKAVRARGPPLRFPCQRRGRRRSRPSPATKALLDRDATILAAATTAQTGAVPRTPRSAWLVAGPDGFAPPRHPVLQLGLPHPNSSVACSLPPTIPKGRTNDLAFSGELTTERSEGGVRPTATAGWAVLRGIVLPSWWSFLGECLEVYGLSHGQLARANDGAVDASVVVIHLNNRLQH